MRQTSVLAALAFALAVVLLAATLVVDSSSGGRTATSTVANALAFLSYAAMGALLAARRPRNPIGWLLLVMGAGWQVFVFAASYANVVVRTSGSLGALASFIWLPMNCWQLVGLLPATLLLFPDGRPLSRRWRLIVWIAVLEPALWVLFGSTGGEVPISSPLMGSVGQAVRAALGLAFVAVALLALASILLRFWRARGSERQQLKWLSFAGVIVFSVLAGTQIGMWAWPAFRQLDPAADVAAEFLGGVPSALAWASVPVAIGIAILRYRLYDIDLLINRTLVYGALTATLAAAYVGAIALFQVALQSVTQESQLAVAASTLLVAALFQPLRAGIQRAVDRRFYRRKYDAAKTLETFGARLRSQVDLETLRAEVVAAARETVQPRQASLWLREVGR